MKGNKISHQREKQPLQSLITGNDILLLLPGDVGITERFCRQLRDKLKGDIDARVKKSFIVAKLQPGFKS